MKYKLGLYVIAFLTLSLNANVILPPAGTLSGDDFVNCVKGGDCIDSWMDMRKDVTLKAGNDYEIKRLMIENSVLTLEDGVTLYISNMNDGNPGWNDKINFSIKGGNIVTGTFEGINFSVNNTNVYLRDKYGGWSDIKGIKFNNGNFKFGENSHVQLSEYAFFNNVYIYSNLFDSANYYFTIHNGDFNFNNSILENLNFDRHTASSPNGVIYLTNSRLKNVGFGVKNSVMIPNTLVIDNSILNNMDIGLSAGTPSVKVANLTIKNIDGVNSYINANIEVTNSTDARDDASLKDPATTGNLTIQNSVIDKRANIKANKYTLIDSDFTGDIKSGTKLSMINSKLKGDISLSTGAVSFDNSIVIGSIVADKLSSKNSTIKGQLVTNTLNATNTTFYIYGGGVNTSFYDSYSGAIIVKDKAIGSGNIIHLANTDLSKLTGNLVPIALVDTKDVAITSAQTVNASKATGGGMSKNFFEVAYVTPLAKYSLNPQYLHFKNFNGIGIWEIGKGSVSNVVDAVDALNIMDGRISTVVTTSPINTSKDVSIIGDMFLAPVYNTVALDNIQDIINMPKYLARTKLDIPYNRYKAFKTNNKNNGIWMNNKNGYSKYKNSSIHYTDINLGIDKVINFSGGSSLMLGLAANLSTSSTKGNYVSDSTSKGIGLYTMSKFDSGAFVGLEGFYHNINTDYEVSSLDIKTNKTHDILQGAFILGQKIGSSVYVEPSLKYDVISYKVEDINTDELKIKGNRQTTHTLTANVEVGVNVADKLSSYIGVGYAKELNDKQDLRIKDIVADHIIKGEKGDDSIKANAGLNYNISSKATLNADFGYNKYSKQGKEYKTNVGFAYRF